MSHTRVAVVQIDFHPAARVHRHSPLEDPLFQLTGPSSLPTSDLVPVELEEPLNQLRARVRREHNRCLMLKLRAVLERCRAWGVKLVLLPEYSVAAELLPELAAIAPELVVIAGTHAVERAGRPIYAQLGWSDAPRLGMAVAPVLHGGRLLALQPKLTANKHEHGSLVLGDRWDPIEFEPGGGPAIPGPLGVMICLDFLFRERDVDREQVGPRLERVRFFAVPSYTPWHSVGEFAAEAWQQARRYGRPVLWANVASDGGSSIFIDEGRIAELQNYPQQVGLLERGDEGVIVADVDLGYRRVGDSTRYERDSIVKPVAVASLVYRHDPIGDRYAAWVEDFERRLDTISEDEAVHLVGEARALLLEAASLPGGARTKRLRRLLAEVKDITVNEEFRQFTREVVLPAGALPLGVLRRVWARECARLVFEWTRDHRGAGLEEVEQRLRAGATPEVKAELRTEAGQQALRETSEAIRGELGHEGAKQPVAVQVRERIPSSVLLHQHEIEGEGLKLVFRATPKDLEALDAREWATSVSSTEAWVGSPRWSSHQIASARRLWLVQRALGRLDASVVGVHGGDGSNVLVCVREGDRRVLLAPIHDDGTNWLHVHAEKLLRVGDSCCDELRWFDATVHAITIEALLDRFADAQSVIDAAVEFQLRALDQASTQVSVHVDDHEQPERGLAALDAWLDDRHEQVALVTGAFGTGKSTLLAQWCQHRWRHEGPRPILANLATGGHVEPIEALLAAAGREPESEPDRAALSLLLYDRRLVVCFDGFDEMATRLAFADVSERMARLLEVAGDRGKVLVASRDHYFSSSDAAEQDMQRAIAQTGMHGLVRLRLQPFGAEQVAEVVRQFIADPDHRERVLKKIHSTYDLEDLVQTPMLLSMVLQTIDELAPGARVGSASIYERYLERFLDHAEVGDQELLSRAQKRAFAEVLAAELWRSGETSLGWARLHKSVMAGLYDVLPTDVPLQAAFLEIQGGSFLVRDGADRFRFAHKSFLEFFMAKGLLAGLERSPEQVLDTARLTPEVAAFVAELLRVRGNGVDDPAITPLRNWLVAGREGKGELEATQRAAANAVRLLRDLGREFGDSGGWVPIGADLRGVVLDREELRGLALRSARLGRASLISADLGQADLTDASAQHAVLTGARLWGTRLDGADFECARFDGVDAHACSLERASFRKATMVQSTWTECDFGQVRMFQGIEVGPTIVDGAGLRMVLHWGTPVLTPGHETLIDIAWAPDDTRIACASYGGFIHVWRVIDGKVITVLASGEDSIQSIAWSNDGTRIAAGTFEQGFWIWRTDNGEINTTFSNACEWTNFIIWAPDDTQITSFSISNPSKAASSSIWRVDDGAQLCTREVRGDWASEGCWSHDGVHFAYTREDSTIGILSVDDALVELPHINYPEGPLMMAWAHNGARIVSGPRGTVGPLTIWDVHNGIPTIDLEGPTGIVRSVAWSHDDTHIAWVTVDMAAHIWSLEDDTRRTTSLSGPTSEIVWSNDDTRIAGARTDRSLAIWEAASGTAVTTIASRAMHFPHHVGWKCGGRHIVSTSEFGGISNIWDSATGARLGSIMLPHASRGTTWSRDYTRAIAFSTQSTHILAVLGGEVFSSSTKVKSTHNLFTSAAWSNSGTLVALTSTFGAAMSIVESATGALRPHAPWMMHAVAAAWSSDDMRLAVALSERNSKSTKKLCIYTLGGHEPLVEFAGINDADGIAWSHDDSKVAARLDNGIIRIWAADTGAVVTEIEDDSFFSCFAWSPDDTLIVTGSVDGRIRIWKAETATLIATYAQHSAHIHSVDWSAEFPRIISSSRDHTIRLWQAPLPPLQFVGHIDGVTSVAWSPDGTRFASASDDHHICQWTSYLPGAPALASIDVQGARLMAVAYSPDGIRIALASRDCRIRIWRADGLEHEKTLEGHTRDATSVAWSPNGHILATGSADRSLRLWDTSTWRLIGQGRHEHWVNCVAWSPDGTKLASGSSDHDIRIWETPELRQILRIDAHRHYVTAMAWSPDGDRLVSSSWDHSIRVWNTQDGTLLKELGGSGSAHDHYVTAVAWSPDGSKIASSSADKSVRIWDANDYTLLQTHSTDDWLTSVAWSPDSTQIVAGSQDHHAYIWRVNPLLGVIESQGNASLIRGANGHFCFEPETAPVALAVPRSDRAATFYLPLGGVRLQQSREYVEAALAGRATPSLAQVLAWPESCGWDGDIRRIDVAPR